LGKNADSGSSGSISKSASTNDENASRVPANSPHSQTDNKNEAPTEGLDRRSRSATVSHQNQPSIKKNWFPTVSPGVRSNILFGESDPVMVSKTKGADKDDLLTMEDGRDASASNVADSETEESESNEESSSENGNGSKKERIGFRDRKIIDYENRIRAYSTPDKIFRYFATYRSTIDSEVYMTPADFLRSLTPGIKQPDGLGLDQFKKFDPTTMKASNLASGTGSAIDEKSIFHHLGCSGLITFSDYIFLLTILSTSKRQFEIAFRMFDLNGDGDVDAEEFAQVQNIIRQTTSVGSRHRDHANTGSTLKGINSALSNYFFGENLDGKLTIERFLEFQQHLQTEILTLEFNRKPILQETGEEMENRIWEKDFADLLLTYADYSPKKRNTVLKRVKKRYHDKAEGIALNDYIQIFSLLIHIDDVDKALYFYNLAGASIDPKTLQHVAKVCANVDLSDHVVDVIFTIFDEDGDGALSNKEFVAVMKNKLKRGLEKPKDTGVANLLTAMAKCAKLTPKSSSIADYAHH